MKKILGSLLIIFATINGYSQPVNNLKFGIKLGIAFANSKLEYPDNTLPLGTEMKTGLIAGCYLNLAINKKLVFQPALLYVRKGAKEKTENFSYGYRLLYNYLEIPLNLLYSPLTKKGNFFFGGGFSPAIKLYGYHYYTEIKKFDLGINVLTGYQGPMGFSINLGYTLGLLNVSSNKTDLSTIRNRYFSITAGYEF